MTILAIALQWILRAIGLKWYVGIDWTVKPFGSLFLIKLDRRNG